MRSWLFTFEQQLQIASLLIVGKQQELMVSCFSFFVICLAAWLQGFNSFYSTSSGAGEFDCASKDLLAAVGHNIVGGIESAPGVRIEDPCVKSHAEQLRVGDEPRSCRKRHPALFVIPHCLHLVDKFNPSPVWRHSLCKTLFLTTARVEHFFLHHSSCKHHWFY